MQRSEAIELKDSIRSVLVGAGYRIYKDTRLGTMANKDDRFNYRGLYTDIIMNVGGIHDSDYSVRVSVMMFKDHDTGERSQFCYDTNRATPENILDIIDFVLEKIKNTESYK